MKYISRVFLAVSAVIVFFHFSTAQAYYVWSPAEGKFISPESQTQRTAEEQYNEALQLREQGKVEQMVRRLRELVRVYPLSAYAPEAQYLIATTVEKQGNTARAASEFQKLVHDFPQSNQVDQAVEHLYQIGNVFLGGQKQKVLGVPILPTLPKAAEIFQFIVENAPYGAYGDQAQFQLGAAHRKMGHFNEAVNAFQKLIDDYPNSSLRDDAHYQLAEASYELSQNASRDQQSRTSAADHLQQFIQQYRTGTLAERAQILKQQLDEQDAEKNYRIGLYYEKQGFVESALIYYEDVASRYVNTPFGQKAQERARALAQPAKAVSQDKAAIEKRMAEVDSLLTALKQEEQKKDGAAPSQDRISEMTAMRAQLEAERVSLQLAEKQFQKETKEKFNDRKKSLRLREKNLRLKFKQFEKRKKSFGNNPSPESVEVFERWHQSLLSEQKELAEERERLGLARAELKTQGPSFRIPHFGGTKSPEGLIRFEEGKWDKLNTTFQQLTAERKTHEEAYSQLKMERAQLERSEFQFAQNTDLFKRLLPGQLTVQITGRETAREALAQKERAFDEARKQFIDRYGLEAFNALSIAADNGLDVASIHDSSQLEKTLKELRSQKRTLSEEWLLQREKVDAVGRALGIGSVPPMTGIARGEDTDKEARVLKKKMKYLEREIRRRLDQIQDWESENETRMHQLDALLHPKTEHSSTEKIAGKVASPATGFYKLTKIFLFGLPNRDHELNQEATETLRSGDKKHSPEHLKAIRELQEEIELQNILIQGRAREVTDMQTELSRLREDSKRFPNFEYQSMLVDRFPTAIEHSVATAQALFEGEDSKAVIKERYDRERQKLDEIETQLKQVDQKIVPVAQALDTLRREAEEAAKAAAASEQQVTSDISRVEAIAKGKTTSQTPVSSQGPAQPAAGDERPQLESELVRMKTEIEAGKKTLQEDKEKFEKESFEWYQGDGVSRAQIQAAFGEEGKKILAQLTEVDQRQNEVLVLLSRAAEEEKMQAGRAVAFLDQKLNVLEKRRKGLKNPSADQEGALDQEIGKTTDLKNQISTDINHLDRFFKK